VLIVASAANVFADGSPSNQTLNVQGVLRTISGDLQSMPVGLVVSLYAAQTDKTPFYSQSFTTVQVENGFFSVELSGMNLSFNTADAWVGIQVAGDATEMPRQHLTAVPYSFVAQNAVGDITPHSVSVNGMTTLDGAGNANIPGNLAVGGNLAVSGSMFGSDAQAGNLHPDPIEPNWSWSHTGAMAPTIETWTLAWSATLKMGRPSLLFLSLVGHWTSDGNCFAAISVDGKVLGAPDCKSDHGFCSGTTLISGWSFASQWLSLGLTAMTMVDAGEHKIGLAFLPQQGVRCTINGSSIYYASIPK
jgi:hypothetical protein